jgi:hypothetical protein
VRRLELLTIQEVYALRTHYRKRIKEEIEKDEVQGHYIGTRHANDQTILSLSDEFREVVGELTRRREIAIEKRRAAMPVKKKWWRRIF